MTKTVDGGKKQKRIWVGESQKVHFEREYETDENHFLVAVSNKLFLLDTCRMFHVKGNAYRRKLPYVVIGGITRR